MFDLPINPALKQQVGRQFIGTSELAAAATAVLLEMGAPQERGTVKDVIDERTVRYYQSEGLLETPTEKRGPASVYEYKHLLALIVIKHLQSADLPIRKIRRIIRGMSEWNLTELLASTPTLSRKPSEAKEEARQYLEQISKTSEWEPKSSKPTFTRSSRMTAPEEGISRMVSDPSESLPESLRPLVLYSRTSIVTEDEGESWKRFELMPGIELNIKQNAARQLDAKGRISLLKKIENIIRSLVERE